MSLRRRIFGNEGESRAERHLLGLGYRLVERSCRSRLGEIDLVMMDGGTLVFVEVKTRASRRFGLGEEAVGPRKQRKLAQLAAAYVRARGLGRLPLRFDVVAVELDAIRHIPNAFQAPGYFQ